MIQVLNKDAKVGVCHGEVYLWDFGRIMHMRVECWASSKHSDGKVYEDDIENEVQYGLPEKCLAQRWRVWQ